MTTNKTTSMARLVLAASLTLGTQAHADEWDLGANNDNSSSTTGNVLFHGSEQTHDVAGRAGLFSDQDWFLIPDYLVPSNVSSHYSSYQLVVDGMTGDLDFNENSVQRLDALNGIVLETGRVSDFGSVISLNWMTLTGVDEFRRNLVRITGAACGASCDSQDRYRVRFYDTTYTIPRFNNTATQSTVLLVQNVSDRACEINVLFYDPAGFAVGGVSWPNAIKSYELIVLATATVVPDKSGSVRIMHTCGYGGLAGKAASVESGTGFTFDTPMLHRPH